MYVRLYTSLWSVKNAHCALFNSNCHGFDYPMQIFWELVDMIQSLNSLCYFNCHRTQGTYGHGGISRQHSSPGEASSLSTDIHNSISPTHKHQQVPI